MSGLHLRNDFDAEPKQPPTAANSAGASTRRCVCSCEGRPHSGARFLTRGAPAPPLTRSEARASTSSPGFGWCYLSAATSIG